MFTKIEVLRYMTYTLILGFATHGMIDIARQDTMGLEGYIQYARNSWVDTPVWFGYVSLAFLGLWIWGTYRRVIRKKEPNSVSMRATGVVDKHGRVTQLKIEGFDSVELPENDKLM